MFSDESLRMCLGGLVEPTDTENEGHSAARPLAMVYAPKQCWQSLYDNEVGHERGTIFKELDFPFLGGDAYD